MPGVPGVSGLLRRLLPALCVAVLGACSLCPLANSQTSEWVWISGKSATDRNFVGEQGVYGTLGTPAPANTPGNRHSGMTWTGADGGLWLFGGGGFDSTDKNGYLNDFWRFDPGLKEWAWMGGTSTLATDGGGAAAVYGVMGISAPANIPGGRAAAVSWTDNNGKLWLFGGDGYDSAGRLGLLNDLWSFDPTTNQWTWMSGSNAAGTNGGQAGTYGTLNVPAAANNPGGRKSAVSWTDRNGKLWLFGGTGFDSTGGKGDLNDLWEFDPSISRWSWMSGSNVVGAQAQYTGFRSFNAANAPGARTYAVAWTASGNLWLFGGAAHYSGGQGPLNDTWQFDPSLRQWAWMSGSTTIGNNPGVYGTLGTPGAENVPGGREVAIGWSDVNGDLWLFGGYGFDGAGSGGELDDLWKYSNREWTWMGGGKTLDLGGGVYGTIGTPAAGNRPGGRDSANAWTDAKGSFWLFGGYGLDSNGLAGDLNDLWNYQATASISTGTSVTADRNPQVQGNAIALTVQVAAKTGTGVPTGDVVLSVDGTPVTSLTLDSTGQVSYSTASLAPGTHVVSANYLGDSFYAASSGTLSESIVKAFLTVTAASVSVSAGQDIPAFTYTVTGFVNGDTASILTGEPSETTTAVKGSAPGTYPITIALGTLSAPEYGLQFVNGTLTVTPQGTTAGLQFIPITPCRVADTRSATGPFGGPGLSAASSRSFNVPQSGCGVPSNAAAYSLNVTVVPGGALDYLTLWPAGQAQPNVSTLNSLDGRIKANAAIVPAGTNGAVSVFVSDASNVILDIDGYFVPPTTSGTLAFYPLAPCRVADTRGAGGALGGPFLAAGSTRDFPIQSSACNIPAEAKAYSLNFTALPHKTLNYLTTWPAGQAQPVVSTLNATTGTVTANAAIVPAGNSGGISVFVSDEADVVLDVNGYFAPPGRSGLSLYATIPCRVADTREAQAVFKGVLIVAVESTLCAPPAAAQAYVLNATVVPPGGLVYLTLWPDGAAQPFVSTLNALDGAITSNMAIVPTENGKVDAFSSDPNQVILDLSSYFAP